MPLDKWEKVGENYGRAVAGEAVLYQSKFIDDVGAFLHITAVWVHDPDEECGCDQQGIQHAADHECQEEYENLRTLARIESPFVTTEIDGLAYVVHGHSFSR